MESASFAGKSVFTTTELLDANQQRDSGRMAELTSSVPSPRVATVMRRSGSPTSGIGNGCVNVHSHVCDVLDPSRPALARRQR